MTKARALLASAIGLILLTACGSAFAPDDAADAGGGTDAATAAPDQAAGSDGAVSADGYVSTSDGASNDAGPPGVDGAPVCAPPKSANGAACTLATNCCSNACASDHTCRDQCKSNGGACNTGSAADCCVGTYCSPNAIGHCEVCHANGISAEVTTVGNVVVAASCCSGHADGTAKCAP